MELLGVWDSTTHISNLIPVRAWPRYMQPPAPTRFGSSFQPDPGNVSDRRPQNLHAMDSKLVLRPVACHDSMQQSEDKWISVKSYVDTLSLLSLICKRK
jgi:hypothetical protein